MLQQCQKRTEEKRHQAATAEVHLVLERYLLTESFCWWFQSDVSIPVGKDESRGSVFPNEFTQPAPGFCASVLTLKLYEMILLDLDGPSLCSFEAKVGDCLDLSSQP